MVLLKVSPCLNHHTRVVSGLVVVEHVLELIWLIVLEQIDDLFELSEVNGHVEFLISWFNWAWDSVVAGGEVLPEMEFLMKKALWIVVA